MTPDTASAPTLSSRKAANARTGLALVLTCVFLGTGISKLVSVPYIVETFRAWGYPTWFRYAIGVTEVLAAVLVLIPATRALGAALVALVMLGAIGTHIVAGQWAMLLLPVSMLAVALLLVNALRPRFEPWPTPGPTANAR